MAALCRVSRWWIRNQSGATKVLCNSGSRRRRRQDGAAVSGLAPFRTPQPIPSRILITQAALCEAFVGPGVGAFLGRSRVLSSHDHRFLGPFFRHTGSPERSIKLLKEPEGRVLRSAATPYSSFHFCVFSIFFSFSIFQFIFLFHFHTNKPHRVSLILPKAILFFSFFFIQGNVVMLHHSFCFVRIIKLNILLLNDFVTS